MDFESPPTRRKDGVMPTTYNIDGFSLSFRIGRSEVKINLLVFSGGY